MTHRVIHGDALMNDDQYIVANDDRAKISVHNMNRLDEQSAKELARTLAREQGGTFAVYRRVARAKGKGIKLKPLLVGQVQCLLCGSVMAQSNKERHANKSHRGVQSFQDHTD